MAKFDGLPLDRKPSLIYVKLKQTIDHICIPHDLLTSAGIYFHLATHRGIVQESYNLE